jgi:hypothetical protein
MTLKHTIFDFFFIYAVTGWEKIIGNGNFNKAIQFLKYTNIYYMVDKKKQEHAKCSQLYVNAYTRAPYR